MSAKDCSYIDALLAAKQLLADLEKHEVPHSDGGMVLPSTSINVLTTGMNEIVRAYMASRDWPGDIAEAAQLFLDATKADMSAQRLLMFATGRPSTLPAPVEVSWNPTLYAGIRKRVGQLVALLPFHFRKHAFDRVLLSLEVLHLFAVVTAAGPRSPDAGKAVAVLQGTEPLVKGLKEEVATKWGVPLDGWTAKTLDAVDALRGIVRRVTNGGEWQSRHWAKVRDEFLKLSALDVQQAEEGVRREFARPVVIKSPRGIIPQTNSQSTHPKTRGVDTEDEAILRAMLKLAPKLLAIHQIVRQTRPTVSERTVTKRLKRLIADGLADRPDGPKSGATITAAGCEILKMVDSTKAPE